MLTEQQVNAIWAQQWGIIKPYFERQRADYYTAQLVPSDKDELPELWPGFTSAYWQREDLLPHMEHGVYPYRLFANRAPNQSQEEFEYIRKNYKQVTLPVALDMLNTIGRAIHRGNYSLEWEAEDPITDQVREYIETGIREWGSVSNFVQQIVARLKLEDSMGVLCALPKEIPTMVRETEDGEVLVVDPDGMIRPEISYHKCSQVWGFEYDGWYLLRLNQDAPGVTWGGRAVPGIACILVDDMNVWAIRQTGKKTDWNFVIELWYEHGVGEAPCIHLGGVPVVRGGSLAFESPFLAAKEPLDVALADAQYLQASKVKTVYPQVVMVGDPCDFVDDVSGEHCVDGKIRVVHGDHVTTKLCPACKGTGKMRRLGPLNELLINPKTSPDGIAPSDGVNATNALTYVSPNTDSVRFIREEVEHNIAHARSILHLNTEAPMAGGDAKTATEAGLNNRAKDAFVKPIADQILYIEEFLVRVIGRQIAGPEWDGFTLRLPTQYDLRTEADRVAEIASARTAGIPPAIVDEMEGDLIAARYARDPFMLEAMEVIQRADRLARMSEATITAEAAAGRVQPWEVALHYAALDMYRELYDTDAVFVAADVWAKVAALHNKARQRTQAQAPNARALNALQGVIDRAPTPAAPAPNRDREMIDGVVDLLRGIVDMDNRRRSAEERLANFQREGVHVDREDFLARVMA
jgi:hypothetical protein